MSSPSISPISDYLSLIGISAIVSTIVSAIFNYFITIRVARKQNQLRIVEEKLALYAYISFCLDKMRFRIDALREKSGEKDREERYGYSSTKNELNTTILLIENKIREKYHLFRQDLLKDWVYISTYFMILQP